MYGRPAGMSDDDTDEEGFSFSNEDSKSSKQPLGVNLRIKEPEYTGFDNIEAYHQERKFEFCIINACMMGYLQDLEEYLDSRNVNEFLHTGWTPLLYAASSIQPNVLKYLLKHGADPNKHKDGYTPIMALCNSTSGKLDRSLLCLRLLIQSGANVNAISKLKETPLMFACKLREPQIIAELLKHVKNINYTDNEGRTALIYAASANKIETVELLMAHNPDISLQERNGLTAREIAVLKGYNKIVSIIKDEQDEIIPICEVSTPNEWIDMFPSNNNNPIVHYDVATIIYGMGLDQYMHLFQGICLKKLLHLKENDLERLGIDVGVHRKQFIEKLYLFHVKSWNVKSLGVIDKSLPYTIYDGVISLGNSAKQFCIVGCSFFFVKDCLESSTNQGSYLNDTEKSEYFELLKKTRKTLDNLKIELKRMNSLAVKIHKKHNLGIPANYIGRKTKGTNMRVFTCIALVTGICLFKFYRSANFINLVIKG